MELDKLLNKSQAEAVSYCDGPQLVIAGAGSGKTRVLTYKIAYLIENGYNPRNILALTFTNKASREMKSRIADIVGAEKARMLWMGTFHSIFLRILRIEHEAIDFPADFIVYDTSDSKSMIQDIVKSMGLDEKVYKPNVVLGRISNAKNHLISPSAYEQNFDIINANRVENLGALHKIYRVYWERCKMAGVMDFDDILVYTYMLLSSNQEIAQKYQTLFRYILVDEYQDTNYAQHSIMMLLTKMHHNICVVGDDAQSIYSFRGANIDNILTFKNVYPETKVFKLEQNYRSTQNIVDAANSLIANNRRQIPKKTFSERDKGNPITVYSSYSDIEEGAVIANKIKYLCNRGYQYKDCAILYRTNSQSRIFEEALRKSLVPYKIYGGMSFYQRKEIKDITAYFRYVCNHNDEEAFRRIINYPKRGIGLTSVAKISYIAAENGISSWDVLCDMDSYAPELSKALKAKLNSFVMMINEMSLHTEDAYVAGKDIVYKSGIMAEIGSTNDAESKDKIENIEELISGMHNFCQERIEEGDEKIRLIDFLSEISLITDQDEENPEDINKVTLMTAHAAKGLEYDNVFIVGMEERLFPSAMCGDNPREIEEERRLFYVAMTRAKDNCFLSFAKTRFRFGKMEFCTPSRFITDISPEYIHYHGTNEMEMNDRKVIVKTAPSLKRISSPRQTVAQHSAPSGNAAYMPGQKVRHARFGIGIVKNCTDDGDNARATIEFENIGEKQLLLKYAKLELI